jgi:hypothetical protein
VRIICYFFDFERRGFMRKFYFLFFVILFIFLYSCAGGGTHNQGENDQKERAKAFNPYPPGMPVGGS